MRINDIGQDGTENVRQDDNPLYCSKDLKHLVANKMQINDIVQYVMEKVTKGDNPLNKSPLKSINKSQNRAE